MKKDDERKGKKQNRRYLSGLLEEGQELLCEAVSHGAGGPLGLFCLVIGSVFLTDGHNTKKERKKRHYVAKLFHSSSKEQQSGPSSFWLQDPCLSEDSTGP